MKRLREITYAQGLLQNPRYCDHLRQVYGTVIYDRCIAMACLLGPVIETAIATQIVWRQLDKLGKKYDKNQAL